MKPRAGCLVPSTLLPALVQALLPPLVGPDVARLVASGVRTRIHPAGALKSYVVADHAALGGAIAFEFQLGNGADNSTPGASIGAPFGGWRWIGTYHLLTFDSDPASPLGIIHSDIGATGPAMQINDGGSNLFGGEFHGGLQVLQSRVGDLLNARTQRGFDFGYDGLISFAGAATAAVQYDAEITPAGDLETSIAYQSTSAFFSVYLSMAIATGNYSKYSLDGGITYADCSAINTYVLTGNPDVMLRNPTTGYTIRTVATADRTTGVIRQLFRQANPRTKDYFQASTQGAPLGTIAASRTISFGKTAPDAVFFDYLASRDGVATGLTRAGETAPTINAGRLYFDRSQTATAWIDRYWDMGTLQPGTYRLTFDYDKTGSGSIGTSLVISTATNGSVTTPTPLVNTGFTNIGTTYDFVVATAADFDVHVRMGTAAASTDRLAFRSIGLAKIA